MTTTTSQGSATTTANSTTTSGAGSVIPEFPVQLGLALLATVFIVMSHVFARRGLQIGKQGPI